MMRDQTFFLDLENSESEVEYWKSLKVVCDEELISHKESDRTGVTKSVSRDIDQLFEKKTLSELNEIETQIQQKVLTQLRTHSNQTRI